jgi:hypothetical protein
MSTEEGNKLIAIFDGYTWHSEDRLNGVKGVLHKEGRASVYLDTNKMFCAKYHYSWNELMPVVEKIRGLGFRFIIGDSNRVTVYNKDYDWRNGSTEDSMIECVWHGVTQFIQYYNSQPK